MGIDRVNSRALVIDRGRGMLTKEELEAEFLAKLKTLLAEYDAEIELEDRGGGYMGPNEYIIVYGQARYDSEGNVVREELNVELGKYFTHT